MTRGSLRALLLTLIWCAVLAGVFMLSGTRALAAGGEPLIGGVSATNVSEHGATLEAQIDPENLETIYEFWVESANCQPGPCDSIGVDSVGHGYIAAGSASQTVSVVLSDLQPHYSVRERPLKEALQREQAEAREAELQAEREAGDGSGGVSLDNTSLMVERTGVVVLKFDCTGIGACSGKLILKAKKGKKKTTTIGTANFSIPAGKVAATKLSLNAVGRALLSADHGRLNTASLTIAELKPAAGQTQTKRVRLIEQRFHKAENGE